MMVEKSAVVAGHICLDIFPGLGHLPPGGIGKALEAGKLLTVGPAVIATGGPVSNTGLALHVLGISTRLMAKVGADLFGNAVLEYLNSFSPDLSAGMVIDPQVDTSYTVILSFPGEDRIFLHHPGANDHYGVEDINYALVAQADLFHFGYPPVMRRMYSNQGQDLVEVFQRVKAGSPSHLPITSLDMTFPDPTMPGGKVDWREIIRNVLPYVDIFMPSFEELFYMLHRKQYEDFAHAYGAGNLLAGITPDLLHALSDELIGMGGKIVVIKLGDRGLYLRTAGGETLGSLAGCLDRTAWSRKELWAPCFQVQVVGTTGAGDATIAGFLSGLLRELTPAKTMTMAVAVGACNVEAVDALSGICSWEDTEERVKAGWRRHPLKVDAPGWEWDAQEELWVGKGC